MFTKIDEIWYDPFKDADEIPETVKMVREAVFNFTAIFQTNKDIQLTLCHDCNVKETSLKR